MIVRGTEVVVRRRRQKLVVQLINRTPKGVKYIKREIPMADSKISSKTFKSDLAHAIEELSQIELPGI